MKRVLRDLDIKIDILVVTYRFDFIEFTSKEIV